MIVPLWLIALLPALGFVLLIFGGRRLGRASGWIATAVLATDAVLAVGLLTAALSGVAVPAETYSWWAGGAPAVTVGFALDPLTAVMLVIVTVVSALVHLFSIGYMADDARYSRYFAFLQLFSASMLVLVLADGLALLFAGWELVGLSSYLLIGFWFERPAAANAAKKAFLTTRVGDVGLLLGVLLLGGAIGSWRFEDIFGAVEHGAYAPWMLTAGALLLFAGAMGKSAQFPLHVWLPDAMEGPTPVSALIHAATMVAAGVYLVARMFPVFEGAPGTLSVVGAIGAITALGAATIAITQTDLKKVLAYSTISQLGLMFLGLGVAARDASVFHLFTHAGFKALLFLGAGSVIHATHEQEIGKLGGLSKRMPWTAWTFVIGALALAGAFPFAGFWSKDEILASAWEGGHYVLFVVAAVTSLLTAIYVFRAVFTVFFGEGRGDGHAHEGGWTVVLPLVALAGVAATAGLLGSPLTGFGFQRFIALAPEELHVNWAISATATGVAALGIFLAWLGWGRERLAGDEWLARVGGVVYRAASAKYLIDEFYAAFVVRPALELAEWGYSVIDKGLIDGAVDLVGTVSVMAGGVVSWLQSGRVRRYAIGMFAGAVLLIALGTSLRWY